LIICEVILTIAVCCGRSVLHTWIKDWDQIWQS